LGEPVRGAGMNCLETVLAKDLHNLLVSRIVTRALVESAHRNFEGRLLDIGCGAKPCKELLAPYVTEHLGVDHGAKQGGRDQVDMFGSAYRIPLQSESVDSVLCTAVLEHLEEPEQALRECHRVLAKGGVAIYTVPFIWHLHEEPRDFYRFSKYGLRYLFEKADFEILELQALSGFWVTFGQLLVYNLYRANRGPLRWLRIVDALGLLIQATAWLLDRFDRSEQWTWMYLVAARRR
jgi:SAM-dependent methyltransferase